LLAKFFIVGTESDYEIYGYSDEKDTILISRLRSDDKGTGKKIDVWYGIPTNTEDATDDSIIELQVAPIFDILVSAPAFSWLGWAGQIGGISGAFGSAWGFAFAIFAWVMSKLGKGSNKIKPNGSDDNDMVDL
jgi:hypothetical protein